MPRRSARSVVASRRPLRGCTTEGGRTLETPAVSNADMANEMRRWQDWASFALALWLAISPWLADYAAHDVATANAAVMGLSLALLAHFGFTCDHLSCEW